MFNGVNFIKLGVRKNNFLTRITPTNIHKFERAISDERIGSGTGKFDEREKAIENEAVRRHEKYLTEAIRRRAQESEKIYSSQKDSLSGRREFHRYLPDWSESVAKRSGEIYGQYLKGYNEIKNGDTNLINIKKD